jgi:hypothetical protein
VWTRESDGLVLTFHLAAINNQNFLMRDAETGSYWQQITGQAISGPLRGRRLTLIHSDELSYALWSAEEPGGTVLKSLAKYSKDYEKKDWEKRILKYRTVLSFADPARGLTPRSIMIGVRAFGASRAFPYDEIIKEKLVLDFLGHEPILLIVGPDGESVRVFHRRIAGYDQTPEFYRTVSETPLKPSDPVAIKQAAAAPIMMDQLTGSDWDFHGCAVAGKAKGTCLEPLDALKDYWFDWRNYNTNTSVYGHE